MKEKLLERFLRYVAVTSQSNAKAGVVPSTEGQRRLAELLAEELRELGLEKIEISEKSVLTAHLPSNLPEGRKAAYDNMVAAGIDALVVIGGDGSLTGAGIFAEEFNVPIVWRSR